MTDGAESGSQCSCMSTLILLTWRLSLGKSRNSVIQEAGLSGFPRAKENWRCLKAPTILVSTVTTTWGLRDPGWIPWSLLVLTLQMRGEVLINEHWWPKTEQNKKHQKPLRRPYRSSPTKHRAQLPTWRTESQLLPASEARTHQSGSAQFWSIPLGGGLTCQK